MRYILGGLLGIFLALFLIGLAFQILLTFIYYIYISITINAWWDLIPSILQLPIAVAFGGTLGCILWIIGMWFLGELDDVT